MEWSGGQQISFLLQSIGLGIAQGLLLDVLTGFARIPKHHRWLWTDVLFGPLAALITFFGALVIMDGQLHPLLLFGTFSGMLLEHISVGRCICRFVRFVRRGMAHEAKAVYRFTYRILRIIGGRLAVWLRFDKKSSKIQEKQ